jgi:hypothetical protein
MRFKADDRTRLQVVRAERADLAERLVAARAAVGEKAASQEDPSVAIARVRRLEDSLVAVDAAIPVLERRIGDAERAALDKAQAQRKTIHDDAVARRAKAAAKVDEALRALEAAFVDYADLNGLETEYARNAANAQRGSCMSAAAHLAPRFWVAVAGRFIDPHHRRPLAESPR